jgi:hypothetical protein
MWIRCAWANSIALRSRWRLRVEKDRTWHEQFSRWAKHNINYAQPLIGAQYSSAPLRNGLPRFTRSAEIYAKQKLEAYLPATYRQKD